VVLRSALITERAVILEGGAATLERVGSGISASGPTSSNATFGIQPATDKGTDKREGFTCEATPGTMKVDYVAITNYTTQQVSLHVYATDAYDSQDGGFTTTSPARSLAVTPRSCSWTNPVQPSTRPPPTGSRRPSGSRRMRSPS